MRWSIRPSSPFEGGSKQRQQKIAMQQSNTCKSKVKLLLQAASVQKPMHKVLIALLLAHLPICPVAQLPSRPLSLVPCYRLFHIPLDDSPLPPSFLPHLLRPNITPQHCHSFSQHHVNYLEFCLIRTICACAHACA